MKYILLASAAAIVAVPAAAQVDSTVTFNNAIASTIANAETHTTTTTLDGDVVITGDIDVDAVATANTDNKQIIDGNAVQFIRGYENDLDDDDDGDGNGDGDGDGDGEDTDGTVVNANGLVTNTTDSVDVDGASGNVAVNAATGYYNAQSNVSTIAVVTADGELDEDPDNPDYTNSAAWGKANTTGWQSVTGTFYGAVDTDLEDDEGTSFVDTNAAGVGDVNGAGNIGVNSAAGAFNGQQNLMTLAVATDSSLANATAGVVQTSAGNLAQIYDGDNSVELGTISGDGNIAVNVAAGVGNLQHNSLTVAASGAFGGGDGIGGLNGNGGFGGPDNNGNGNGNGNGT